MKGVEVSDRVGQLTTRSQGRDPSTALRAGFGHPKFEVELEIGTVPVAGGNRSAWAGCCACRTLTDLNWQPDANGLGSETVFEATCGTGHVPGGSKWGIRDSYRGQ